MKIGTTSLTVRVTVEARRGQPPHETARVIQAEVVYVAVDKPEPPGARLARRGSAVLAGMILPRNAGSAL